MILQKIEENVIIRGDKLFFTDKAESIFFSSEIKAEELLLRRLNLRQVLSTHY